MSDLVQPDWKTDGKPHVAIVGAGVAGLRCADVLLTAGIDVTLYEGKPNVGGRVHQVLHDEYHVDMGANWIHGTLGNPILDIAKETGTTAASMREETAVFSEFGCEMKLLDKDQADTLNDTFWGLISDAFQRSNGAKDIRATTSLLDFFMTEAESLVHDDEDKRILLQLAEQWGHFAALSIEQQSLKYFWMEECLEGENLFVADSYRAILERIARKATSEAYLRVGPDHTVVEIVTLLDNDPPRCVVHSLSESAEYDACIVTVPLGVLKQKSIEFVPPEPDELRKAIDQLGFGCLEKAYVTFPRAWWRGSNSESDNDSAEGQSATPPAFTLFLHPQYDRLNTNQELVAAMDLSLLPEGTAHPTLLFYFYGDFARRAAQAYVDEDYDARAAEEGSVVVTRMEPYFKLLPHYDSKATDCMPVAAIMTSWSADELAGYGAYTNFPYSTDEAQLDRAVETLRAGMPDRNVYIAGEHTAPFVALGTVTGAYWSGERAAKEVIERFRVTRDEDTVMEEDKKE